MLELTGLKHGALTVSDLEKSIRFYCDLLGFKPLYVHDQDWAMLGYQQTSLSLIKTSDKLTQNDAKAKHPQHFGLLAQSKTAVIKAYEILINKSPYPIQKPKLHRDNSFGFYLQDPDQNDLEIIFIPPILKNKTQPSTPQKACILFGHGSRNPNWIKPFEKLKNKLEAYDSNCIWQLAFLERTKPDLKEAISQFQQQNEFKNLEEIVILPIFLANGNHIQQDILPLIDQLQKEFHSMKITLKPAIGETELFLNFLTELIPLTIS